MSKKYGYTFVYGVDGFGADVAPAYEEGIYLDFNKAWAHFIELTARALKAHDGKFETWDWSKDPEFGEELILTKASEVAKYLWKNYTEPPFGWYLLVEVEIK